MKEFSMIQDEIDELFKDEDLDSYVKQLIDELRQDEEVYEILKPLQLTRGEVKDNISKLSTFRKDHHYCKNCPGVDKCEKCIRHSTTSVTRDGALITLVHTPCDKILEQYEIDAKYLRYDADEEWKDSSIRDLDLSQTRKPVIKEFVNVLKNKSSRWLYLYGNRKTGKSFLAVTMANDFVKANLGQIAVCNTGELFRDLKEATIIDKEGFALQLKAYQKVDLLVLDNFGEEYKTEYIRDEIVIPLLSERERNGKITIFTSEFKINEVQQMYQVGSSGGFIRAKQLGNILKDACIEELDLTGASIYRK